MIDTFLGPIFASTRQPAGVESFPAFLRAIRDAIGERELSISVLERARKLASAKRTVMPALPECLAFCDQAKAIVEAEHAACALARATEQRRETPDLVVAARADALRGRLRNRLGCKVFEARLQKLECERIDGAVLVVSVPTPFIKKWIDENFSEELRECAATEFSGIGQVKIVVRGVGPIPNYASDALSGGKVA